MSQTACQLEGEHIALAIELDREGEPVAVRCTDWQCGRTWPVVKEDESGR
jgi:hypothetical protein